MTDDANDLVGLLRKANDCIEGTAWMCDVMHEAADRIEVLEKKVDVYKDRLKHCSDEVQRLEAANAKLRRLNPDLTGYANGYADALADMPDGTFSDAEARVAIELQRKEIERLQAVIEKIEQQLDCGQSDAALKIARAVCFDAVPSVISAKGGEK